MITGTFYIRIGRDELTPETPVEWAVVEATGVRSGVAPLTDIVSQGSGHRLTVLVPTGEVLQLTATLPTRRRQQLRSALPYLLEEQLAEDVERLHFAVGPIGDDLTARVAVVDRTTLEGWLSPLREAGLVPQTLVAEGELMATDSSSWSALFDGSEWLLTDSAGMVNSLPADGLDEWLAVILAKGGAPERLRLYRSRAQSVEATAVEQFCQQQGIRCERVEGQPLVIDYLLSNREGSTPINLLQGEYSPAGQIGRRLRPWRYAAALAGALLLVEGGAAIAHYQQLKGEVARLDGDIEQLYRDTFPEARKVVNPRAQMEQRLAALNGGGGDQLGRLLGRTGPLLSGAKGLVIETLAYRQQRLELEVAIGGFEALDRLKQQLAEAGLEVAISGANAEGGRVRSQLRIREGGA